MVEPLKCDTISVTSPPYIFASLYIYIFAFVSRNTSLLVFKMLFRGAILLHHFNNSFKTVHLVIILHVFNPES